MAQKVAVSDTVVYAELDNDAVLLNVDSGIYFGIDEVGTRIWQMINGGATEDEIVATLYEEYEVSPERLRSDVRTFVEQLVSKGLACYVED